MARIMVVDDARFTRLRIARILESDGHEVLQAENGSRAVELYHSQRPDAVLLDIVMPVMDGLAALGAIRRLDPSARVLMVSTMGQKQIVTEALKAGAIEFVVKPVKPETLLAAVNRVLAHSVWETP